MERGDSILLIQSLHSCNVNCSTQWLVANSFRLSRTRFDTIIRREPSRTGPNTAMTAITPSAISKMQVKAKLAEISSQLSVLLYF